MDILVDTSVSRRLKANRQRRRLDAYFPAIKREEALLASRAHPRALVLWMEIKREVQMGHPQPITLGESILGAMGLEPRTRDRALDALEQAGLIRLERHRGRLARIWVLGHQVREGPS